LPRLKSNKDFKIITTSSWKNRGITTSFDIYCNWNLDVIGYINLIKVLSIDPSYVLDLIQWTQHKPINYSLIWFDRPLVTNHDKKITNFRVVHSLGVQRIITKSDKKKSSIRVQLIEANPTIFNVDRSMINYV